MRLLSQWGPFPSSRVAVGGMVQDLEPHGSGIPRPASKAWGRAGSHRARLLSTQHSGQSRRPGLPHQLPHWGDRNPPCPPGSLLTLGQLQLLGQGAERPAEPRALAPADADCAWPG